MLEVAETILALYDNRERFERLKRAYKTGSIIPFVGAGLSIPSGYLGWTAFLYKLCDESYVPKDELDRMIALGEYEEAAQRIFDDADRLFNEGLVNHFAGDRDICGPVHYLPYIFGGSVFTTNFDSILKRLYDQSGISCDHEMFGDDSDEFAELLGRGKRILLRLHGHCDRVRHRIITKSEYDGVYSNPDIINHLIRDVIFRKSLLFIGCSLAYDRLQKAMTAYVGSGIATDLVSHFAFAELKDGADRVARRRTLASANIFPIWYPEGEHDESIDALLLKLTEGVVEF
jgi:SIR2-like domain